MLFLKNCRSVYVAPRHDAETPLRRTRPAPTTLAGSSISKNRSFQWTQFFVNLNEEKLS